LSSSREAPAVDSVALAAAPVDPAVASVAPAASLVAPAAASSSSSSSGSSSGRVFSSRPFQHFVEDYPLENEFEMHANAVAGQGKEWKSNLNGDDPTLDSVTLFKLFIRTVTLSLLCILL